MRSEGRRRGRAALWAAALAALALAGLLRRPRGPDLASQRLDLAGFAAEGEAFRHGVEPRGDRQTLRLPLAGVLADLAVRAPGPLGLWLSLPALLEAALVLAVGAMLMSWGGALLALGLLLLTRGPLYPVPGFPQLSGYPYSALAPALLAVAGLMVAYERRPGLARAGLLAAGLGATLTFRSNLLLLPPLLAAREWLRARRGERAGRTRAVLLLVVPYLFLAPWVLNNWARSEGFRPLELGAADLVLVGGASGIVSTRAGFWGHDRDLLAPAPPPSQLSWALGEIARHPARYAGACLARVLYIASLNPAAVLLGLAGAWLWRRRRDWAALALLTGYYAATHCVGTITPRYVVPFWPLACLLAAGAAARAAGEGEAAPARGGRAEAAALGLGGGLAALGLLAAFLPLTLTGGPREEALERALSRSPGEPWLLEQRGLLRLSRGDAAAAAPDLAAAAAGRPEDQAFALEDAWARALTGDPAPLLAWTPPPQTLGRALGLALKGRVYRAHALARLGRPGEARAELREALAVGSSQIGWHSESNEALAAEVVARPGLRPGPGGAAPDPMVVERVAGFVAGRPVSERRATLEALLDAAPGSARAWLEKAALEAEDGRKAPALAALARASSLGPTPGELRRAARLYARLGERQRAWAAFSALGGVEGAEASFWLEGAELAAERGDKAEAERLLARAEAAGPEDRERERLARLARGLGLYRRALEQLEATRRPEGAVHWLERAELCALLGERNAGFAYLARAEGEGLEGRDRARGETLRESLSVGTASR